MCYLHMKTPGKARPFQDQYFGTNNLYSSTSTPPSLNVRVLSFVDAPNGADHTVLPRSRELVRCIQM